MLEIFENKSIQKFSTIRFVHVHMCLVLFMQLVYNKNA